MKYTILLGEPEIKDTWNKLFTDLKTKQISREDKQLLGKWSRAIERLKENPHDPALDTHEIEDLSKKFGAKVFQSYLENKTKSRPPYRLYWVYGPERKEITLIALIKHPNKKKEYSKISLSSFPE